MIDKMFVEIAIIFGGFMVAVALITCFVFLLQLSFDDWKDGTRGPLIFVVFFIIGIILVFLAAFELVSSVG